MITLVLLNAQVGFGWPSLLVFAASIPGGYWVYREYAESLRLAFRAAVLHPHLDAFATLVAGLAALVVGLLCVVLVLPLRAIRRWRPAHSV